MNSSHDKQEAVEEAVQKEINTELNLMQINAARKGEKLRVVHGFIDDRVPITHGRKG